MMLYKLKALMVVVLLMAAGICSYIAIANRNSVHMTGRQKFLKGVYPVWIGTKKLFGKKNLPVMNDKQVTPPQSFYDLAIQLNNGSQFRFDQLKGKKVLLVNTASDCGFTPQYNDLQKLDLVVCR